MRQGTAGWLGPVQPIPDAERCRCQGECGMAHWKAGCRRTRFQDGWCTRCHPETRRYFRPRRAAAPTADQQEPTKHEPARPPED